MANAKIVIIEDEMAILQGISAVLGAAGFISIEAADGESGLAAARHVGVDLVLLDLMLPAKSGMDVLRELRLTHPSLPVIILSARGSEEERVAGLKAGADDYVIKPFSARELVARVEAVLRRSPERPTSVLKLRMGDTVVDLQRHEIDIPGQNPLTLSEMECAILSHLAAHRGRAISRNELLARLWGLSGRGIETRTVDMHVARLRSKISANAPENAPPCIVTVRGKGYMLGPDVALSDPSESPAP